MPAVAVAAAGQQQTATDSSSRERSCGSAFGRSQQDLKLTANSRDHKTNALGLLVRFGWRCQRLPRRTLTSDSAFRKHGWAPHTWRTSAGDRSLLIATGDWTSQACSGTGDQWRPGAKERKEPDPTTLRVMFASPTMLRRPLPLCDKTEPREWLRRLGVRR